MSIEITELIKAQAFESLIMFYAGLTVMLFYEICAFVKHKTKMRRANAVLMDLCFWILAAFITGAFLYYCAFGKISVHVICFFSLGAFLWKKLFYGIILKS